MAPTLPSLLPGCIGALCKVANIVQGGVFCVGFCVLFRVAYTVLVMYTMQGDILNVMGLCSWNRMSMQGQSCNRQPGYVLSV